jgi:2-phosphoglycerate kinase
MDKKNSWKTEGRKLSNLFGKYLIDFSKNHQKDCENIKKKIVQEKELKKLLKKVISDFKKNKKNILAISISGFAGVGKTFSVKRIEKISQDFGVEFRIIGMDSFLGTVRGSKERKEMPESWKNFKNNFYNHDKLQEYIDKIFNGSPDEIISEKGVYDRSHGGKLNGTTCFKIPRKKFVLVIEGVNATDYLKNAHKNKQNIETLNIVVLDDLAESFLRAIFRDVNTKKVGLRERIVFRLKEYSQMWRFIVKNLKDSDIVVLKNNISDVTHSSLVSFMEKSGQTKEEILTKIKDAEEEFEKQKFETNKNKKFLIKSPKIKKYLGILEKWINKKISREFKK